MPKQVGIAAAIYRSGYKLNAIAEKLGMNRGTLRAKLNGSSEWRLSELMALKDVLGMGDDFWTLLEVPEE